MARKTARVNVASAGKELPIPFRGGIRLMDRVALMQEPALSPRLEGDLRHCGRLTFLREHAVRVDPLRGERREHRPTCLIRADGAEVGSWETSLGKRNGDVKDAPADEYAIDWREVAIDAVVAEADDKALV